MEATRARTRAIGAGYDVIGDVHGQGEKLEGLLDRLGYRRVDGTWTAPEGRQAVFVGDLIDRGPNQLRVLEIAKGLVDDGAAQITLGNHELNALAWSTEHPEQPGTFLRPHEDHKRKQHRAFLDQLSKGQRDHYLRWFWTLPLWLDLGGIRVVHACWDEESQKTVEDELGGRRLREVRHLVDATTKGHPLHTAVEILLKGPELALAPHGLPSFCDKDGTPRDEARLRWWAWGTDKVADLVEIPPGSTTPDGDPYPVIADHLVVGAEHQFDGHKGSPIFYGHYWRKAEHGLDFACTTRTACVDFSAGKGGPLVAYRWSEGEAAIDPGNYVTYR